MTYGKRRATQRHVTSCPRAEHNAGVSVVLSRSLVTMRSLDIGPNEVGYTT